MKSALLGLALCAAGFAMPAAALADTPQHLVDSATLSLQDMMGGPEATQAEDLLRKARAVVVCPNIFRAGFILGGEGGGCLMVARKAQGGWSGPAFYTLGSASFGFQAGVQSAEVMMLVMTTGGLNALLDSQFKFGADAGLTVATLGAGVNGSMSTAVDADIVSISKTEGLYGGISLQGSVLNSDSGTDASYYGENYDARQIVVGLQGTNPGANPLRAALGRYGG
jgi:lipid-binding SYLF domain-containing protein